MIQNTIYRLLFFVLIEVQDLTMVRRRRSGTLGSVMNISQGREDTIPFVQPQGNVKLHLPTTGIHAIHYSPSNILETPHWHMTHDPSKSLLIIRQRQREIPLRCNCLDPRNNIHHWDSTHHLFQRPRARPDRIEKVARWRSVPQGQCLQRLVDP